MALNGYEIEGFTRDLIAELLVAADKFPQPNPNIAAMTEEAGEVARAVLHIRERKSDDWQAVRDECVQLAAMALRIALEGDPTVGAPRPAEFQLKMTQR